MPSPSTRPATALTIAGSDPSGGAGIQADLKTFAALGVYGCAVLTALTAQSTRGVSAVHQLPESFVAAQLETLFEDITIDAVKVGMLGDARTARVVYDRLTEWKRDNPEGVVVLDPVMVSTSGHKLLADEAVTALREGLFLVDLITPNLPEAALLLSQSEATTPGQMSTQAIRLAELGAPAVLVKGGHLLSTPHGQADLGLATPRSSIDVLLDRAGVHQLTGPAVDTPNTHGTGCTLSSALAASAAGSIHAGHPVKGLWKEHAEQARAFLLRALAGGAGWRLGAGSGPVNHLASQDHDSVSPGY